MRAVRMLRRHPVTALDTRALFDPDAAAVYDRLPPAALKSLRSGALDSVYEVTAVSFGTTPSRGS